MTRGDLEHEQERLAQLETYAADLSRTYSELRRHLHQLTVLHEVTTRIASALDPDEVLVGMLDALSELVAYETAAVYLLDVDVSDSGEGPLTVVPSDSLLHLRAGRFFDGRALDGRIGSIAGDAGAAAAALDSQHTVTRTNRDGDLELAVPLRAAGRTFGALELGLGSALPEEDVQVVDLLASSAAVALQNAHLYRETQRLATTDPLTGLANYRHFHDTLNLEVQRARRMDYPVGLVLLDLDHFKQINDRHGHPAGDLALRRVADVLLNRLRRTDVVGRLGGEEFGLILPGASIEEVAFVAEKVRGAVEALPPLAGDMGASPSVITLSAGGTSVPARSVSAEILLSSADRALYEAKHAGRNQVKLWRHPASE